MKFSVIVPVYNVEKYVAKCIDSILAQNYDDYEIVAVDDGATDNSGMILDEYQRNTDKLHVIHQENKGLGGARNTGITAARGEYLVFLDSDDYIAPNMLLELEKHLNLYELDILAFDCIRVDEEGNVIERVSVADYPEEYTDLTQKQFLLLEPTSCTKVYRRKLYIDHEIQFPERLWYEDLATVFKLAPYANKIGYLKKAYYYYVQQPNSITHSVNTKRMLEIIDAFGREIAFYKKNGLFEEYYNELEWNCALHVLYYTAFRLLTCGFHKKEMLMAYQYSKSLFPNIENNKYVLLKRNVRYHMDLIMDRKYFQFYIRNGLLPIYVPKIKRILNKLGLK